MSTCGLLRLLDYAADNQYRKQNIIIDGFKM